MGQIKIPALHHMRLKKNWMFKTINTQIRTQHPDSTSDKIFSSSSSDYSVLVSCIEEAPDVFNPLSNTERINAAQKFCIKP